jgi:hypothetical protein
MLGLELSLEAVAARALGGSASPYGPELLTVPYSGSVAGSWVITGTNVTRNGSSGGNAQLDGTTGSAGNTYRVAFDVAGFSGDSFTVLYAGSNVGQISANGSYVFPAHSGAGGAFQVIPWAGAAGQATITNLSVKQVL